MEIFKIIAILCSLGEQPTCNIEEMKASVNHCQSSMVKCFKIMRPASDNDKDAINQCIEIKDKIGF